MRFHELVDRPNLFVKIPGTEPGLGAIEDCIAQGRSINITLIFSLERHAQVIEAYLRGLERLVAGGGDPAPVASVASFFVSRVDTETDRRLEELGRKDLQGKLAIANAKLAYQQYLKAFSGDRWQALAAEGAHAAALPVGVDVDQEPRLPRRPVRRGADRAGHGEHDAARDRRRRSRITEPSETRSPRASTRLASCSTRSPRPGVDYDDVVETLEREGIEKFSDSLRQVLDGIEAKRAALVA